MSKEVKFVLLYRDMWQSAGKYVPRVDQLLKVAPEIIKMGCFARVETNGGGFEQVNLLFGENPNVAVRKWTKPFRDAGIQTQMLDRGLNGLRMSPVPDDVRKLFYKVKKAQGTDIARIFDGLNDTRNIIPSIKYSKEAGMIAQASLCITFSPIHTVEYYTKMAYELIEEGADEICLKDMAGIGRPTDLGEITANIKKKYPHIPISYHGHAGPGFSVASVLEVSKAGCDFIDVGMDPLSWGTGHPDLLTIQAMLKQAGFDVPEVNMAAYMKVRALIQESMDDFLGLFISPKNRQMNSLLIAPGLPGGMMGSLMADLETNITGVNRYLSANNKPTLTQDDLLIKLFDEVAYVWPKVGYPPLVTPFSQYVKNLALMNVTQLMKGRKRWSMIADDIWDMILGKAGRLPGEVDPEIKALAKEQNREFYTGNPQDAYPNALHQFRDLMKEKGWEWGEDDEELFEYAMHPSQYEAYKSGKAKKDFEEDLAKHREAKQTTASQGATSAPIIKPQTLTIEVDGEQFSVKIVPEGQSIEHSASSPTSTTAETAPKTTGQMEEIQSPLEGKFFLTKDGSESPIKVGDSFKKGDRLGYIEAMKTYNAILAHRDGVVAEVSATNGSTVYEDDVLFKIQ